MHLSSFLPNQRRNGLPSPTHCHSNLATSSLSALPHPTYPLIPSLFNAVATPPLWKMWNRSNPSMEKKSTRRSHLSKMWRGNTHHKRPVNQPSQSRTSPLSNSEHIQANGRVLDKDIGGINLPEWRPRASTVLWLRQVALTGAD